MNLLKQNYWLIAIIILSLFIRFWWINIFPVGITHDEMDYIINAKAIYLTGKDTTGIWSPLSLTAKSSGTPTAELPSLIMAPFIGLLNLSFGTTKIPYIIFNVLLIVFTALITKVLINRQVAIATGLIFAINPWSIHFSRTAFESPLALCFFFIALYVMLKTRSWKILWAFPFLFLGFFSYHGTKLIFLPFVLVISTFHYFKISDSKSKKPYLVLFLFSLLLFIYFIFSLKYQSAGRRTNELLFIPTEQTSKIVDFERRTSIPTFAGQVFSNKATYIVKTFISKYFASFSSIFLFISGEQRGAYSTWVHGLFYYIDFPLLLLGIFAMANKKRSSFYLLCSLTLIAPLPAALSNVGESYVLRAGFMFPLMLIFIAFGIMTLIKISGNYFKTAIAVLAITYSLFLVNFLYIYFLRYPVYGSEGFFFSERVLSEYAKREKDKTNQIIIVAKEPKFLFEQYLFYSKIYKSREVANKIAETMQLAKYTFENVKFIDTCEGISDEINAGATLIINKDLLCPVAEFSSTNPIKIIANTVDGGEIFRIYNDQICNKYSTRTYPQPNSISAYKLSEQSDQLFCDTWIMLSLPYSDPRTLGVQDEINVAKHKGTQDPLDLLIQKFPFEETNELK